MVDALRAEGVPAAQMYDGRPVYTSPALAARRTASRSGPWRPDDAPDSCPRTEDLAARSITVGIGPAFTAQDCDEVAAGVRKVAGALLGSR